MKSMILTALLMASFAHAQTQAPTLDDVVAQAEAAYAQREYNVDGQKKAQQAADLYAQAAALAANNSQKAKMLTACSEATFFVGVVAEEKQAKIDTFLKGLEAATKAAAMMGVTNSAGTTPDQVANLKRTLSVDDLKILGDALYQKGANLGQWGTANGVVESLGKWPELRDTMQLIIDLGLKDLRDYGANRILGRGYFKIPGLLGGSNKKAEKYLSAAVNATKLAGANISSNATNNLYYAEVLHDIGKEQEAISLLNEMIAADPAQMNPKSIPETKDAQREAHKLLADW